MAPEKPLTPLSPEQEILADFFLETCELGEFADHIVEMDGQTASVRYGLGRCAKWLMDLPTSQIAEMVNLKIKQQDQIS